MIDVSLLISHQLCSMLMIAKEVLIAMSPERLAHIHQNSAAVNVFSIRYRLNGSMISTFIIEPKQKSRKLPCKIWSERALSYQENETLEICYAEIGDLAKQGYIVAYSPEKNTELIKAFVRLWPNTDSYHVSRHRKR